MSAPDHWVTLSLIGRVAHWSGLRLYAVSLAAAAGHAVLSAALGLAIVVLGLAFARSFAEQIARGTGVVILGAGLAYGVRELLSDRSEDYEREAEDEVRARNFRYFAVLGAALSPDLSILPIFLLAIPGGFGLALDTALVFGLASVTTLPALVYAGSKGLDRVFEKVPPKYNDSLVGFVVAAVGAYIVVGG